MLFKFKNYVLVDVNLKQVFELQKNILRGDLGERLHLKIIVVGDVSECRY